VKNADLFLVPNEREQRLAYHNPLSVEPPGLADAVLLGQEPRDVLPNLAQRRNQDESAS